MRLSGYRIPLVLLVMASTVRSSDKQPLSKDQFEDLIRDIYRFIYSNEEKCGNVFIDEHWHPAGVECGIPCEFTSSLCMLNAENHLDPYQLCKQLPSQCVAGIRKVAHSSYIMPTNIQPDKFKEKKSEFIVNSDAVQSNPNMFQSVEDFQNDLLGELIDQKTVIFVPEFSDSRGKGRMVRMEIKRQRASPNKQSSIPLEIPTNSPDPFTIHQFDYGGSGYETQTAYNPYDVTPTPEPFIGLNPYDDYSPPPPPTTTTSPSPPAYQEELPFNYVNDPYSENYSDNSLQREMEVTPEPRWIQSPERTTEDIITLPPPSSNQAELVSNSIETSHGDTDPSIPIANFSEDQLFGRKSSHKEDVFPQCCQWAVAGLCDSHWKKVRHICSKSCGTLICEKANGIKACSRVLDVDITECYDNLPRFMGLRRPKTPEEIGLVFDAVQESTKREIETAPVPVMVPRKASLVKPIKKMKAATRFFDMTTPSPISAPRATLPQQLPTSTRRPVQDSTLIGSKRRQTSAVPRVKYQRRFKTPSRTESVAPSPAPLAGRQENLHPVEGSRRPKQPRVKLTSTELDANGWKKWDSGDSMAMKQLNIERSNESKLLKKKSTRRTRGKKRRNTHLGRRTGHAVVLR